jgi:hypothetical protein
MSLFALVAKVLLEKVNVNTSVPSNRVNFVTFFAQNIFFTKLCEGAPYFFSGRKFIKNLL